MLPVAEFLVAGFIVHRDDLVLANEVLVGPDLGVVNLERVGLGVAATMASLYLLIPNVLLGIFSIEDPTVVQLGTLTRFRASQIRAISWFGACLAVSAGMVLIMALIGTTATARMWSDSMAWEIALRRGVGA